MKCQSQRHLLLSLPSLHLSGYSPFCIYFSCACPEILWVPQQVTVWSVWQLLVCFPNLQPLLATMQLLRKGSHFQKTDLGWLSALCQLVLYTFHSTTPSTIFWLINVRLPLYFTGSPKTIVFAILSFFFVCPSSSQQWVGCTTTS